MDKTISKSGRYLGITACIVALAACAQNPRPEGAITSAGAYGGTVVAYPVGEPGYGYPFDYGYYGFSPYGAGAYGFSPYAYGYQAYPYGSVYPPAITVYRAPRLGRLAPHQNRRYGLQPWGQEQHRIAVPRPPAPAIAQRSFGPPAARVRAAPAPRPAPPPRQAERRPSGRH